MKQAPACFSISRKLFSSIQDCTASEVVLTENTEIITADNIYEILVRRKPRRVDWNIVV